MKPHQSCKGRMLLRDRGTAVVLVVLALPLLLGAWKTFTGPGINRSYVERIQNGKTKKPEILTWFGDPQETKRTPEGLIFIYKTFRAKQERAPREVKEVKKPADTPFQLEENLKKRPSKDTSSQELASSLTIRFQPDGETVQSHDYQEF
jgi:hypothetical protein